MALSQGDHLEGKRISERYRIKSVLKWTELTVFAVAEDMESSKAVDLILLDPAAVKDSELFKRELKKRIQLKHPNLLSLLDSGIAVDGEHFVVFEKNELLALSKLLKDGARPLKDALTLCFQAIDALSALNKIAQAPQILLADEIYASRTAFSPDLKLAGLAISEAALSQGLLCSQQISAIEKARYCAPEIFQGQKGDERSQIYSLACLLYHLLSGHPPFESDDLLELESQHLALEPKRFHVIRPDLYINPALENVILKALSKDPKVRQISLAQFKAELSKNGKSNLLFSRLGKTAAILLLAGTLYACFNTFAFWQDNASVAPTDISSHAELESPEQVSGLSADLPAPASDATRLGVLKLSGNNIRVLKAGNYLLEQLDLSGNARLLASGDGPVRIWILPRVASDSTLTLSGNSQLACQKDPQLLEVYDFGSADIKMTGNSRINASIKAPLALLDAGGNAEIKGSFCSNGQKLSGNARFVSEPEP